ncbi:hypothetical protein ACX05_20265, partial [Vibrio parahaemolyticus]
ISTIRGLQEALSSKSNTKRSILWNGRASNNTKLKTSEPITNFDFLIVTAEGGYAGASGLSLSAIVDVQLAMELGQFYIILQSDGKYGFTLTCKEVQSVRGGTSLKYDGVTAYSGEHYLRKIVGVKV